jgi:tetratricopeptide (TPR) repeat protein
MDLSAQILVKNALDHLQRREFDRAAVLLEKALISSPNEPDVLRLMAVNLALQFKFDAALKIIDQVLAIMPNNGLAHSNRGNILKELGRHEEALNALDKAISMAPNYAEAYNNKGNVLQEVHQYGDALEWFDKAIAIKPDYAEAFNNKGNCLAKMEKYDDAMSHYNIATSINPRYVECYWAKSALQLSLGEFDSGWQNYEARWHIDHPVAFLHGHIPRLESLEDIPGKRILIWAEQGLGDTLQFCRYIEPLFNLGAHVTFVVPASLMQVLIAIGGFCNLVVSGELEGNEFDFQSPLLSLPLIFKTSLDSLPQKIPYLRIDESKKADCKKTIKDGNNLKVGLIWNGGFRANHPELWETNKRRNIELDQIAILKDVPGVDFYSLQKGDPAESEFVMRKDQVWPNIINCAPLLNDFADTAALMGCLDLIISVDTSSAHLAGALGKPVWILNRYDSCWRWLRGREDSPWYPTAKIYQQKTPGDWSEVISRVKLDLNALAEKASLKHSDV